MATLSQSSVFVYLKKKAWRRKRKGEKRGGKKEGAGAAGLPMSSELATTTFYLFL